MDTSVKVILLVKTKPELYDVNHPDYGNKRHHTIVWKQLAGKMGVRVQHLKAKWNSLRNSYARTIRQEILNPKAPEKSWYLKSYMTFLKPHVAHKIKRSQYLEKIRNGELELDDDDSQATDFNDIDESTNMDYDKDEEIIVNSPQPSSADSENEDIEIENQPIDCNESDAQARKDHNFTINEEKNQQTENEGLHESSNNVSNNEKKLVEESRSLSMKSNTNKNNIEQIDKLLEKHSNTCRNDGEQLNKKTKLIQKKIKKKEKSKKFDQILELLSSYCIENMKAASKTHTDNLFFQSIMSDFEKLSDKNKRKFKTRILTELNDLLDETELENVLNDINSTT